MCVLAGDQLEITLLSKSINNKFSPPLIPLYKQQGILS